MRRGNMLDEAVKLINFTVANEECGSIVKGTKRTAKRVPDGISATLADIGTSRSSSLP